MGLRQEIPVQPAAWSQLSAHSVPLSISAQSPSGCPGCTGAAVSQWPGHCIVLLRIEEKGLKHFVRTLPYIHVFWDVYAPPRNLVDFVHMPTMPAPGRLAGRWLLL